MTSNDALNWWSNLPRPRRLMLTATVVLFVSQFFMYSESTDYGMLSMDANYNTHGTYWFTGDPVGTGWQIHWQAKLIIPLLAVAYLSKICEDLRWRAWGYLASVFLVFFSMTPGQQWMTGMRIGFAAMAIAIWAAVENRRLRIKEKKAGENA
jgi:hypothetical protein